MRQTRKHPLLTALLAFAFLFGFAACGSDDGGGDTSAECADQDPEYAGLADMGGQRIGVQSGTTGHDYAGENAPEGAEIVAFDDTVGMFGALESGDIVGILQDIPVNAERALVDECTAVVETFPTGEEYGFAVAQGNELRDELNEALATVRDDGTYDLLYDKYFPADGAEPGPGPEESDVEGSRTLTICSDIPYAPMEMEGDGPRGLEYTGFDIELVDAMAVTMDADVEVLAVGWEGILGNLASGTCDLVASSMTITEERAEEADFTDAYFSADQSLLVKRG